MTNEIDANCVLFHVGPSYTAPGGRCTNGRIGPTWGSFFHLYWLMVIIGHFILKTCSKYNISVLREPRPMM